MSQTSRTVFAGQAVSLAEMFKHTVGKQRLEGAVTYAPELSAPDGESTAGGKQALQHLKLIPAQPGNVTLVMGSAHIVEKRAELRSHATLARLHRQRFKGALLPVDPERYAALLATVKAFFDAHQFAITLVDDGGADEALIDDVGPASAGKGRTFAVIGVVAAAVIGAALFLLRR